MEIKVHDQKTPHNNPGRVAHLLKEILLSENEIDQDKEHFWVLGMTSRNTIRYVEMVSLGTLDNSLVEPRETFRMAILKSVKSIIVGHNHPSGVVEASIEDIGLTRRLVEAGKIIGINVLDHVIITKEDHCSFLERGLL